ncbi:MAG TPA: NAD(+) diphosphatase [Bacillota bacterium]|jgi:NAD+ diphosphatase|nr:NAD(+) diphosphatase [Peptococcaceae bacterium MAG4]HPZ42870.1 NAD(+) diphosphatase [Bacillota bacterium]HQD75437.1 NAD(+) diphosphatase [Bacillota bacterium]HUM58188.1 NAD(+) diphosphatase [Bacillota bacterium]
MNFVPEAVPVPQAGGPAHWFVFRRDELLVCRESGLAVIPYTADNPVPESEMIRKIYLGRLGGSPCYAVEVSSAWCPLPGTEFLGLRKLPGLMEEDLYKIAGRASQLLHWDSTHQYCGRCGARTETKADEHARFCPVCGLTGYPRISPAVICLITRGKQILLVRRAGRQHYSIIAGFVEPGESLEESLRREVREEVGIEITNIKYFGSQPWPFPHSLMVAFTACYAGGDLDVDMVEIVEAGWYTAGNLPGCLPPPSSIARKLVNWFVENFAD